jgi:YidC/Oxa1 family membrane protein insertase
VFDSLSRLFGIPLTWSYELVGSYGVAIAMVTVLVMMLITPLTLKSTKGMLEMQRLQPELRRLQNEHRGDRQKLNEEMMKLYQEHKVNPLASCLPLVAQMPVFFGMFHLLRGLTQNRDADGTFAPRFISESSRLFRDLDSSTEMKSFGLDLARSPSQVISENLGQGLIYAALVLGLALLYWAQQRMIANRTVNPTMSASQQKLLQYLPVAFAGFQLFFPTGLVIYYVVQSLLRIGQQAYITRRFYGGEHSLGQQAQAASRTARDIAAKDKGASGKASSRDPGSKVSGADAGKKPTKGGGGSSSNPPTSKTTGKSSGKSGKGIPSRPTPKKPSSPSQSARQAQRPEQPTSRARPKPPSKNARSQRPQRPTKPSK